VLMPLAAPGRRDGGRLCARHPARRLTAAWPCRAAASPVAPGRWRCASIKHLVPPLGGHPPDLAVLTLGQDGPKPGALSLSLQAFDLACLHVAFGQPYSVEEPLPLLVRWTACHLHDVRLFDAIARMHEPVGQLAIIGQQQ